MAAITPRMIMTGGRQNATALSTRFRGLSLALPESIFGRIKLVRMRVL
jgi:hypothetical protein